MLTPFAPLKQSALATLNPGRLHARQLTCMHCTYLSTALKVINMFTPSGCVVFPGNTFLPDSYQSLHAEIWRHCDLQGSSKAKHGLHAMLSS